MSLLGRIPEVYGKQCRSDFLLPDVEAYVSLAEEKEEVDSLFEVFVYFAHLKAKVMSRMKRRMKEDGLEVKREGGSDGEEKRGRIIQMNCLPFYLGSV